MSNTNVAALDRALADGEITEQDYAERLETALAADAENVEQARLAEIQAVARTAGLNRKPAPQKAAGHPNDGRVTIGDDGMLVANLSEVTMIRNVTTGKVSGYCRVLVNGKAIGALTIYSPADMADDDKAQSRDAMDLRKLADRKYRMIPTIDARQRDGETAEQFGLRLIEQARAAEVIRAEADALNRQADAAQKRFDDAKAAAKLEWAGRTAWDVVQHKQAY